VVFYFAIEAERAATYVMIDLAFGCALLSLFTSFWPLSLSYINEYKVARAVKQAEDINSVEQLLPIPEGYSAFLAFCVREFAAENVLFWKRCDEFKKLAQLPLTPSNGNHNNPTGGNFGGVPSTPKAGTGITIGVTTTPPPVVFVGSGGSGGGSGTHLPAASSTGVTTPVPVALGIRALASDSSATTSTPSTHRLQHPHNTPAPLNLNPTTSSPIAIMSHLPSHAATATAPGTGTAPVRIQLHTADSGPDTPAIPSITAATTPPLLHQQGARRQLLTPSAVDARWNATLNAQWSHDRINRLQHRLNEASSISSLFIERGSVHELNMSSEMRQKTLNRLTTLYERFNTLLPLQLAAMAATAASSVQSPTPVGPIPPLATATAHAVAASSVIAMSPHAAISPHAASTTTPHHHNPAMSPHHGGNGGGSGGGAITDRGPAMSPQNLASAVASTASSPTTAGFATQRMSLWPAAATSPIQMHAAAASLPSIVMVDTFQSIDADLATIFDLPLQGMHPCAFCSLLWH
jgi:hypothetical protein